MKHSKMLKTLRVSCRDVQGTNLPAFADVLAITEHVDVKSCEETV